MNAIDSRRFTRDMISFHIFTLLGIAYMFINPFINHKKFYADSRTLVNKPNTILFTGDSFASSNFMLQPVHRFIMWVGVDLLDYSEMYDAAFFFTNLVYCLLFFVPMWVLWINYRPELTKTSIYMLASIMILSAPFYGVPTKEIIPFYLSFFASLFFQKQKFKLGLIIFLTTMSLYASIGRTYFFIMVLVIVLHVLLRKNRKLILFVYVVGLVISMPLFAAGFFDQMYYARPKENIEITNTWINYFFYDYNFWGFIGNRLLEFLRLMFPIELLMKSPKYLPHFLFQLVTTWYIIQASINRKKISTVTWVSTLIVFGFTIAQASFEPDFGSFFRHKMSIFPFLYLAVVGFSKETKKGNKIRMEL